MCVNAERVITDSGREEVVALLKLNDAYVEKKKFKEIYPPDTSSASKDRKEENLISGKASVR